jgi:hypothetical protein
MWFQVHCPPLVGVLPTFRSRYLCAIGHQGVLSLAGWAPRVQTSFHVSGPTQVPVHKLSPFAYWTITIYGGAFQPLPLRYTLAKYRPYNPQRRTPGFGLIRFRSPLLTESLLLSFPPGTEMFQFPGFAPGNYGFIAGSFRDPGINSRLTDPPGLSQSSTPFIASWCQGIPHTPLVAWPR